MEARAAMEKLLATLEADGVRWKPVIRRGDARTVISSEILGASADLVVLGTHGRAGLAHVLVGSVAEWVIATALCDVLVGRPMRFTFALP
jgi:nucleotide-binding universal stress UspA family protein